MEGARLQEGGGGGEGFKRKRSLVNHHCFLQTRKGIAKWKKWRGRPERAAESKKGIERRNEEINRNDKEDLAASQ